MPILEGGADCPRSTLSLASESGREDPVVRLPARQRYLCANKSRVACSSLENVRLESVERIDERLRREVPESVAQIELGFHSTADEQVFPYFPRARKLNSKIVSYGATGRDASKRFTQR